MQQQYQIFLDGNQHVLMMSPWLFERGFQNGRIPMRDCACSGSKTPTNPCALKSHGLTFL